MCSVYRSHPGLYSSTGHSPARLRLRRDQQDEVIRPTNETTVYLAGRGFVMMRWGYSHPKFGTVHNARIENLTRPMWRESATKRRCLIPATGYYEFSGLPRAKQAHLHTRVDDTWLWIAGVWERSPQHGLCFSMVTTTPNAEASALHDRMPAILEFDQLDAWLDGGLDQIHPPDGILRIDAAPNPLRPPSSPEQEQQGELPLW